MGFEDFISKTGAEVKISQANQKETERRKKDAISIISKTRDIFNYLPDMEKACDHYDHLGDRRFILGEGHRTPFVALSADGVEAAIIRDRFFKRNLETEEVEHHSHAYTLVIRVNGADNPYAKVEEKDSYNNGYTAQPTIGYAEDRRHESYKLFVPGTEEEDREAIQLFSEVCDALERKYGPLQKPDFRSKDRPIQHLPTKRRKEVQPTVPAGWSHANKRRRFFKKK